MSDLKNTEIERKFLVESLPPEVSALRSLPIRQGYLVQDEYREVRLRMIGKSYFLTVKEGSGLVRSEVETPISHEQFQRLWPMTEGRRIEKERTQVKIPGATLEIDRYLGNLSPLCVAEVEFPSVEASESFEAPTYFGTEVTERPEFANAFLAVHGIPHADDYEYQIGSVPYLYKGDKLHLVVITNSSQTKWILPKGCPEPDMSRQDVAVMETVEEAGVIGNLLTNIRTSCKFKDGRILYLFPLHVTTVLKKWPEAAQRRRQIVPFEKAIKLIGDKEIADCLHRLAPKLTP